MNTPQEPEPRKPLFTDLDELNDDGQELATELCGLLQPVISRWVDKGFLPREVMMVILSEAGDLIEDAAIDYRIKHVYTRPEFSERAIRRMLQDEA